MSYMLIMSHNFMRCNDYEKSPKNGSKEQQEV